MDMSVAPPVRHYRREDYVETPHGTKFAHASGLYGAANITLVRPPPDHAPGLALAGGA